MRRSVRPTGFEQAVSDFQQALDLDPSFAAADAGLANAYFVQGQFRFMPPEVAFERARGAAQSALALNPNLAATLTRYSVTFISHSIGIGMRPVGKSDWR